MQVNTTHPNAMSTGPRARPRRALVTHARLNGKLASEPVADLVRVGVIVAAVLLATVLPARVSARSDL